MDHSLVIDVGTTMPSQIQQTDKPHLLLDTQQTSPYSLQCAHRRYVYLLYLGIISCIQGAFASCILGYNYFEPLQPGETAAVAGRST